MLIIGIAGGTGCGKTTVVNQILNELPEGEVGVISQDSYYKDTTHLDYKERVKINFDHPRSIDFDLLTAHLKDLKNTNTMPVALPGCSFFLGIPYTPVRKLMDSGMPVALASDFNPGSAPSGNMNFVVSLACIKMNMTPEEAINAATLNGAYAMNISDTHGSITKGKKANLIITKNMTSFRQIPYHFANNPIHKVMINGTFVD